VPKSLEPPKSLAILIQDLGDLLDLSDDFCTENTNRIGPLGIEEVGEYVEVKNVLIEWKTNELSNEHTIDSSFPAGFAADRDRAKIMDTRWDKDIFEGVIDKFWSLTNANSKWIKKDKAKNLLIFCRKDFAQEDDTGLKNKIQDLLSDIVKVFVEAGKMEEKLDTVLVVKVVMPVWVFTACFTPNEAAPVMKTLKDLWRKTDKSNIDLVANLKASCRSKSTMPIRYDEWEPSIFILEISKQNDAMQAEEQNGSASSGDTTHAQTERTSSAAEPPQQAQQGGTSALGAMGVAQGGARGSGKKRADESERCASMCIPCLCVHEYVCVTTLCDSMRHVPKPDRFVLKFFKIALEARRLKRRERKRPITRRVALKTKAKRRLWRLESVPRQRKATRPTRMEKGMEKGKRPNQVSERCGWLVT
jgi:hypothetical protein